MLLLLLSVSIVAAVAVFSFISKSFHLKLLNLPLKYAFTPQVIGLFKFYCCFIDILRQYEKKKTHTNIYTERVVK